jgi:nickel transport protein
VQRQIRRACRGHALFTALLLMLSPPVGLAHQLLHEVIDGEAAVLRFYLPGTDQPGSGRYEVLAPGVEIPFQSGRINVLGEVSFRPDRPGAWRVRVFTPDGHGATIDLKIDAAGTVATPGDHDGNAPDYWLRVLAAFGYLLGAFGLLVMWRQRHARAGPD